jgi:hypothetical protein
MHLGLEWQQKGPNYYSMLGVTRSSSPLEIKRSFRTLSLQLHPDKNPSPEASSQFDTVKKAYDSLMDMELREVYNKFGHEGIQANKRFNEQQFLLEVAIYYVSYGMLTFLLTMSKRSGDARNWALTGLMVMLIAEVVIMTSASNPIPAWLAPQMTEHEVVWLLHSLYPAFMNGCRSLGSYLYVDLDAQTRQFLMALNEQNKDILLVLRDLQLRIAEGVVAGNTGAPAGRLVGEAGGHHPRAAITPTGKLRELQDRLRSSNTTVAQAVTQLKPEKSSSSNMGFYLMILGYIVVSYVFS